MRRLLRFLKLAHILDQDKDEGSLDSLCAQFGAFVKKHGYFIPDNKNTRAPNPWRKNLDYAEWEKSPYFGSVSEFMEKFPGGIKDWLEWRKKNNKKDIPKGASSQILKKDSQEAFDLIAENIDMYKEIFNITDGEIKNWLENKYKISRSYFIDVKKDNTENFPNEPRIWSDEGPSSFDSILEFLKKYRNRSADDGASKKAVEDFIEYWELLRQVEKRRTRSKK